MRWRAGSSTQQIPTVAAPTRAPPAHPPRPRIGPPAAGTTVTTTGTPALTINSAEEVEVQTAVTVATSTTSTGPPRTITAAPEATVKPEVTSTELRITTIPEVAQLLGTASSRSSIRWQPWDLPAPARPTLSRARCPPRQRVSFPQCHSLPVWFLSMSVIACR